MAVISMRAVEVILVIYFLYLFASNHISLAMRDSQSAVWLLLLCIFLMLSVIPRGNFLPSQLYWCLYIVRFFLIVYLSRFLFRRARNATNFIKVQEVITVLVLLLALVYLLTGLYIGDRPPLETGFRLYGFMSPNYLANSIGILLVLRISSLVLPLTQATAIPVYGRNWFRSLLVTLLLLLTFVWTGSRGAFVALLSACIAMFGVVLIRTLKKPTLSKSQITSMLLMALLVLASVFFVDQLFVLARIDDIISGHGAGRDQIWSDVISLVNTNNLGFLWGLGGGASWTRGGVDPNAFATHNDYLWIFIDFGLIGLILFLYLNIHLMARLARKGALGLLFALIFVVVSSLFNDFVNGANYAFFIGYCISCLRLHSGCINPGRGNLLFSIPA